MITPTSIEVRGIVLGAIYEPDGRLQTPDPADVLQQFKDLGYSVQAVSLGVDGCYRIEVLS